MVSFRLLRAALAALCLAQAAVGGAPAHAETISNIAQARWSRAGIEFNGASNRVDIEVAASPATIETYAAAAQDGEVLQFPRPVCGSSGPGQRVALSTSTISARVNRTEALQLGQALYLKVLSPAGNVDSTAPDAITITVATTHGDLERVTAYETGPSTGTFLGVLPSGPQPWSPVQYDCRLSVAQGDRITAELYGLDSPVVLAQKTVDVLADPYGLIFDSRDGKPVSGARVTLIDERTGNPATVLADDGVTSWPATVISGEPVTDGAGQRYAMAPGEYRFPLAPVGTYRILVTPPSPYTSPSLARDSELARLRRPEGKAFTISPGSFGRPFVLADATPVRLDVPVDRPLVAVALSKSASRAKAAPGDPIIYTVTVRNPDASAASRGVVLTDTPSPALRIDPGSFRMDGRPVANLVALASDGRSLSLPIGDVGVGETRVVTYAAIVRADAGPGVAENRVKAIDAFGASAEAASAIEVEQDGIAGRMTLIGRVIASDCREPSAGKGVPNVRLVMEDGSFAITDAEGRYHFEGLVPGTHVVQVQGNSLPKGATFARCGLAGAEALNASSRFVRGQGGGLARADFHVNLPAASEIAASPAVTAEPVDDRAAAGADIDWLALGDGPTEFLFPAADHNPRAPAIRVAIRHRVDQAVTLRLNGKPVDPLAFDGTLTAPGGRYAVSVWRGLLLDGETSVLSADVRTEKGKAVTVLTREVHYAAIPAAVELLADQSTLVADGHSRPVVAVRVLDRKGRPVHAGISGQFELSQPYESAAANDAMQARALTGRGKDTPQWTVTGDDGIARIELAPTMVSGKVRLAFEFGSDEQRRRQEIESWIVPGDQPWTLVGLAEGSLGVRDVADNMERTGRFDSDLGNNARIALYAKGKVLGRYLVTLAYDSAKQREDQRLLGAIDPNAYYTVFADGSERRFDAASREKLYVRIESAAFYALFGDFNTGFEQTKLASYQRVMTGVKTEASLGGLHIQGFAANSAARHRRDEIQGGGISGPYRLSSRGILPNSEVVAIETRDRLRSELIVGRRVLTRFVDYDIDMLAGTIRFREPVLSRDPDFNPQFIVIDYEVDGQGSGGDLNAGLRADWTAPGKAVRVGTTLISDTGHAGPDGTRTNLAALDVVVRPDANTELRAELGASRTGGKAAYAWLVEAERHDGSLDLLAYARSAEAGFGVGQLNTAERGRTKAGVDARYALTDKLSVTASAWIDTSLADESSRKALELGGQLRTRRTDGRFGFHYLEDRLANGELVRSAVFDAGVTQRFFQNQLEVTADTSLALGKAGSIDLPERHRLMVRLALLRDVKLVASYEIAQGAELDARTFRAGFEASPWGGAKLTGGIGNQQIGELGKRSFALFGIAQTVEVSKEFSIDATLDGNRTLGGLPGNRILNTAHPVANGGTLGDNQSQFEDFTAVTLGASWHKDRWSSTVRAEWRDSELAQRKGLTFGAIRQLGEGSMVGAGMTWTRAVSHDGAMSEVLDSTLALAHRPDGSRVALLAKAEFRSDSVRQAVNGEAGAAGRSALTGNGDMRARRLIASVSANWTPMGRDGDLAVERAEIGLFGAVRHTLDTVEGFDLAGTTVMGGLDVKASVGRTVEIGGVATLRYSLTGKQAAFAIGPQIGIIPAKDTLLTVGYNVAGFRDRDFSASRHTDKGVFVAMRIKFDADSFGFLGLGRSQ